MSEARGDLYLTTRLLMIFYWLSLPALCLILIGALHWVPKHSFRVRTYFLDRYWPYLKNLTGFGWVLLGLAIFFNTVLAIFYLVDIITLNNHDKYSIYWASGGRKRPLSVFWQIIVWGYAFYLLLAFVSYKKYWK